MSRGLEATGYFRTDLFCEAATFPVSVLRKHWPGTPIHDDITTLSVETLLWHGVEPDVVCGGFPCQDLSVAGRGAGLSGSRSGLWFEMIRVIDETKPKYAIIENVSALRGRGLDSVLGGLASIGYDAEWHCIPAAAVGAPHRRDRIWVLAYPASERREAGAGLQGRRSGETRGLESPGLGQAVAYPNDGGRRVQGHECGPDGGAGAGQSGVSGQAMAYPGGPGLPGAEQSGWPVPLITPAVLRGAATQCRWRRLEPGMGGTDDGLPARVHRYPVAVEPWEGDTPRTVGRGYPDRRQRLMSLGNSLVPAIAEMIGRAIIMKEESL
ncbi:S-adenosyl-L-methionine-dependent methyltransferase [uncultured Caudovirales phage]|uniref:DNA (cytosine-5-)-methyltransferase n=1 Tax=uncultured Caudovirales phage TaxID=2100421 RepID=A0A6J5NZH9_9CAUD|nr:S-adenosyl-L-methionine-dependent methyltransferase [uncultured Caudovirales phage]